MDPLEQAIEELKKELGEDVITTGSNTSRPEKAIIREAFDDFNERNPLAGGGMLVEPGFGGVRQGYSEASEKVINFAKQFKEKNGDLPTQQEIMKGTGAGSSTIKRHLKEGVDFKKVLSPGETSVIAGKKSAEKKKIESGVIAPDDKEGLKKLQTKVNKLNRVNNLKNKGIKFNVVPTQAGNFTAELSYLAETYRNKLNKTKSQGPLKNLIEEFNKFRKTDLFKKYDKGAVMREAGIKSAKKQLENIGSKKLEVFDYLLNNKNATIEEIGKALKMSQGSVKKNLQGLYTDVYKRVADQGAVFLKDYNINQLDSVHDSIKNTKVPLKDRVKNFVIDAYKGDENLKPILKKLDDFYALQSEIKKTPYGKFFAANLDHVVPLNFLRELEKGVSPMDLIRVRPIPEFLNQRAFKAQFDRVLGQAYATKNKKALEAIVNLQSYLPKEFGGITPEGKITDYGAKPFSLKTDLSQAEFPEIYKRVFEFIKNPDLQDTFKETKVSFKNLLSQEKNIIKLGEEIKNFKKFFKNKKYGKIADVLVKAGKDGGLGNVMQVYCARKKAKGGRIFLSEGSGCPAARQDPEQFLKDISKDKNVARFFNSTAGKKAATAAARVGLNVINPSTLIGGEVAYVLADGLNNFSKGMDFAESFDRAFIFADFKFFDEAIMNKAKELKFDDNQLKVLQETMNINRLDNEIGKLDAQDRIAEADKSLETPFANTQVRDKVNKQLDQSVDNYLSTLRKMGFKFDNVSDYDTGFNYLDNVFKKKTQDELVKTYQARARQVDPTSGKLGNVLDPLFDLGAYTQPFKYAADIVNPFTKNVPFKSERQREADRLREMEGRELYLYNKQRGFDLDSITDGTSPYISEVMQQLGGAPTGEGMFASFAGGGIAGLSGGIDEGPQRISMNPDSQGLSGLLKNGKKI